MILGVNVDHVATLRQARLTVDPEPLMAATLALLSGADGITVHLREDRRHINDRDLRIMRELVSTELNLEMAATDEMVRIAMDVRPDMVTLVPEKRQELTTEGGLDVGTNSDAVKRAVDSLGKLGIPVSLFINPDREAIELSKQTGAKMVEIHTGRYADTRGADQEDELLRIKDAIRHCLEIGIVPNAGHGLNYANVSRVAEIEGLRGLYIGHGIIARAVLVGMERAVSEMKDLIESAAPPEPVL